MEKLPAEASVRESMTRRLLRRAVATGSIELPAVPGMLDEYMTMCADLFASLGVVFNSEELAHLRGVIDGQLAEAYRASPRSDIIINYDAPVGLTVNYRVSARWSTVEQAYNNWVATRQPPLFGTEPDARVVALAGEAGTPAGCPVLDIGAGTGRNLSLIHI